ncbi:Ferredoxin reductase-type FAD-binding domain protein [Apiospora marii]|uniref:Ferredoxin reductase-type FAD-binding domain protein n=1 Tax=Apiospora marii TaxID=335849 RepID=A0ABR1RYT8_9PEZI
MATAVATGADGWHAGERAIQHTLLGDRERPRDNPTFHGLAPSYGYRVQNSPLVAFGALDRAGRPWTTIWGGEAGFCRPVAQGVLGVRGTAVDAQYDPVLNTLFGEGAGGIQDGEVVRPEGGKVMSGLSIDLETRDRVKLAGRLVAGAVSLTAQDGALADLQMAFQVTESLGNCPKYLNKKRIVPHVPRPQLLSQGQHQPLPDEAIELVHKADLFFISSKHGAPAGSNESSSSEAESMDTNHRGGPAGLVRVFRNDASEGVALVYPEYSGNRLYQTLGNLQADPAVGLAVPDFATGDVLYLTGRASILVGDRAAAYLPRCKLAVRIDVRDHRFVRDGLPFRGSVVDYSPYNPPVRRLVSEKAAPGGGASSTDEAGLGTARLVSREEITPTISRYLFQLSLSPNRAAAAQHQQAPLWHPGQHVTLDFGPELDHGWSHMRDDDPQSLNDDFVRTFTVSSSHAPPFSSPSSSDEPIEFEITVRRHGPATGLLAKWNPRVPLELPVLGFGGEEAFRLPILAQAAENSNAKNPAHKTTTLPLKVLWSLRSEDLALAVKVVEKDPGLGKDGATTLFVTGSPGGGDRDSGGAEETAEQQQHKLNVARLKEMGVVVKMGRMGRDDVLGTAAAATGGKSGESKRRFFCCTGPELMKRLLQWTEGEDVVFESFQY